MLFINLIKYIFPKGGNMKTSIETISINGVDYVRADQVKTTEYAKSGEVIIRTFSAGVHVGVLEGKWEDANKPIVLKNARRIWKWTGANTLNEISTNGVNRKQSRISEPVAELQLIPIEVIPVKDGVDLTAVWNA